MPQSPPLNPKPRSAVPSYLLNGSSPLHQSPQSSRAQERENLASSIKSTYGRKSILDLGDNQNATTPASDTSWRGLEDGAGKKKPSLHDPARDLRDEAPPPTVTASRPASPYTLNPPIDFDGLSWPCTTLQSHPQPHTNTIQPSEPANASTKPPNKHKSASTNSPTQSAPSSSASAKTPSAKACAKPPNATPKHSCSSRKATRRMCAT